MIVPRPGHCRSGIRTACLGTLLVLALALAARAQPEAPGGSTTPPGAADAEQALREQTIYIPYSKLREVFEREGRGVFLPYEKFRELWEKARLSETGPTEARPPVGALIAEVANEATVSKDVVRVTAALKIEILERGWHRLPLGLGDSALVSARVGDVPARVLFTPERGYELLVEADGDLPKRLEVNLEYAKAYSKSPGQNSVTFAAPQAPVSQWRLKLPESGVKVNIQPLIAATEVPAADPAAAGTEVLAYVGAAPQVSIDWTPKAEGASGLDVLANVEVSEQVIIDEGITRTRARLDYAISRAELSQLVVALPADQKVVNVSDANARQWSVENREGRQVLSVQLFEPAKGRQSINLELERISMEGAAGDLAVPVIEAQGVGRQQGLVVVRVADGLRAEVLRRTGLAQVDAVELPQELSQGGWTYSYRYAAAPFDLGLSIQKIKPRLTLRTIAQATLVPEEISLDTLAMFKVEEAGVFKLELELPAGYQVRSVTGVPVVTLGANPMPPAPGVECWMHPAGTMDDALPAAVDSFTVEGDAPPRLVVNLSTKALGSVALGIKLVRKLTEPNLTTPTGNIVNLPLAVPRAAPGTTERSTGAVVVFGPESLRINPQTAGGLRPVPFEEAFGGLVRQGVSRAGVRPVLAFAHSDEPIDFVLAAERRQPQVTVGQLLSVHVDSGVARYKAGFFYDVLYSGVPSLRIDVPADISAQLHNATPGIREKIIDPPPADLPAGLVAWSFTAPAEFLGQVKIDLDWEQKLADLEVGKSLDLAIPHLRPFGTDRAWGQIVISKADTIDVGETGTITGVRPIDPQVDLMAGATAEGAARAFEFQSDWTLSVSATRYQLEEIKRTSIERALLRMVITRGDQVAVQALYRMRSAAQRLVVALPANVEFDTEPLRINGKPVPLEKGDQGDFFIPLVNQGPDQSFVLEIRYAMDRTAVGLSYPVFPTDPAMQKVYLSAFIPDETAVLDSGGPWTDEVDVWSQLQGGNGAVRTSDDDLIQWVIDGVSLPSHPRDSFPTQGRLLVFSTLRPDPSQAGLLTLRMMDRDTLRYLFVAGVLLAGLLLLFTPIRLRAIVVGVALSVLIVGSVLEPLLVREIADLPALAAAAAVLVMWALVYVTWTLPRTMASRTRPAASPFTAPPTVPSQPAKLESATAAPAASPPVEGEGKEAQP
jgi:hypothetical protein